MSGRLQVPAQALVQVPSTRLGSAISDDLIAGDTKKPGAKGGVLLAAKGVIVPGDFQKGLCGCVLGGIGMIQPVSTVTVDRVVVLIEQQTQAGAGVIAQERQVYVAVAGLANGVIQRS